MGAIIGAISSRRKDTADIAAKACDILTDSVIKPLREQVESQEEQIQHLEVQQRKYFALTAYTRSLFHWLQQFCEIVEPDFLQRHPKPHLPDELRADVARRPWRANDLRHRLDRSRRASPAFQPWRPHVTPP